MSTKRYSSKPPLTKGPNNRWLCRCGCNVECQPPRRTFASDNCVHTYLLRRSGSYLRRCVKHRDKTICAHCQLDCGKLRRQLKKAKAEGAVAVVKQLQQQYPRLKANRSYWEADHIIPVVKGGGESTDLNNFRTLCIECHLKVTNALKKELKEKAATSAK